jgi:hypothetical protein
MSTERTRLYSMEEYLAVERDSEAKYEYATNMTSLPR